MKKKDKKLLAVIIISCVMYQSIVYHRISLIFETREVSVKV